MKLRVLPTGVPWIQEAQTCFFDLFSPSSSQRRFLVSATFSREQGTWIWKSLKVSEKMGKCGQRKELGVRSPGEFLEPWLPPLTHCAVLSKSLSLSELHFPHI